MGDVDVEGVKQVIFITEYAHDDRRMGADPLDIRDDRPLAQPPRAASTGHLKPAAT